MNSIRFCISQKNFLLGDFEKNKKVFYDVINDAKKNGVDFLIFPEYSLSGAFPYDLLKREEFLRKEEELLLDIISFTEGITLMVGGNSFIKSSINKRMAFIIKDKKIIWEYNKKYLQNLGNYDENKYFYKEKINKKDEFFIFKKDDKALNCLISMGEDFFHFPDENYENIDLIINLSTNPYYVKSSKELIEKYIKFLEKKNINFFVFNSNCLGMSDSMLLSGGSFILNGKNGILLAKEFDEDFLICDVPVRDEEKNQKEDLSFKIIDKDNFIEKYSLANFIKLEERIFPSEIESIYDGIIFSLKEFFKGNNFKKVVIGLSGGIDSALVLVLLSKVICEKNIYAVSMPSIYSSDETKKDAFVLAKNLNVNFLEIPIETIKNGFLDILSNQSIPNDNKDFLDIAIQNVQARIRGNILMMLANSINGVVISTGNKSEVLTGYCTLYGDTVGGFAPISDIYKTKVFELARFINDKFGKELILQSIIDREPSAELKFNQKDSDSLPKYEILDKILEMYVDKNMSSFRIKKLLSEYKDIDSIVDKVIKLFKKTEYKRRQMAFGPKITKGFFDRKMPIINNFYDF